MNHPENELNRILYQLRCEHQSIEAPSFLEEHLAQKARLNAGSRASHRWNWTRGWAWGLGFALVAIASTIVWWLSIHASLHPPQQIVTHPAPAVQTPVIQQAATAQGQTSARQVAQTSSKPRRPAVQHAQAEGSHVVTTSFLLLPASEGLPEPAQQSIVRTRILTSSLPQYGLEVPASMQPQLVSAEFLVGEDGLPRAIRFVR
jgi:hypothetical protein